MKYIKAEFVLILDCLSDTLGADKFTNNDFQAQYSLADKTSFTLV